MDWRAFAKRLLLQDNRINDLETALLKRAILADGVVDQHELEFLLDLKRSAGSVHPDFDRFLASVLKKKVLGRDGEITDAEALWLRQNLIADHELTEAERQLVRDLKRGAKKTGPEFKKLCDFVLAAQVEEFSRE